MKVWDLHCDALSRWENVCFTGEVSVEKMLQGQAAAQCFAVFAPWGRLKREGKGAYETYLHLKTRYERMLSQNQGILSRTLCATEAEENRKQGKISAVLTVEGGDFLEGDLSRLEAAYRDGVRMIALTWNNENELGVSHSPDEKQNARGLTALGCQAVERMQELGIVVDLSHLNRGGFFEAAFLSRKPFVCSHSCCDSLCPHSRNLTDAQLRLLGQTGSVVGLNFYSRFLRKGSEFSLLEDLLAHASHVLKVAGEEALGLGSDFDGRDTPIALGDWSGMPILTEALSRRFGSRVAEKIAYQNVLRLWREAER